MGLFSFIGKAVKGIAGVALGVVPGGGFAKTALGLAGSLLAHKASGPMQSTPLKIRVAQAYNPNVLRGRPMAVPIRPGGVVASPPVLRASPVMPGGAVATSQGIMAPGGGVPPATFSSRSSGTKRKRRSSASRKSSRARSSKKRSSGGRKLKFGSPAWRKKYLKKHR